MSKIVVSPARLMDNPPSSGDCFQSSARPPYCVAVIDDEPLIREIARVALSHSGYSVIDAIDGSEGIELIKKLGHEISVVLLDITMPVLDGAAVLRWMRANGYSIPVVLCSGYSEIDVHQQFRDLEYHSFLPKPFTAQKLVHAIRMAVGLQG